MKEIEKAINNPWIIKLIWTALTILISIIIYKLIIKLILKVFNVNLKTESDRKKATYIKLAKSICRYLFILITFLFILQIFGINISSVIAGVGLLGVIFGLAIQDWLKDIIRGSTILSDNYFKVGDIVKYNDIEGKVLVLGIKTTKIKSLSTGNIISISNRNIEQIEVVSNNIYFNIPLSYELKQDKVNKVLKEIVEKVKKIDNIKDCKYLGPNNLNDSSIDYLIGLELNNNEKKLQSRRDAINSILITLESNNIEIPYNQLDIHNK